MKRILVALLVVVLVATSSAAVANAKPDKPARPEKLDQVIFVHPVAPDKPGKPDKPPGKPPKEEEPKKDISYSVHEFAVHNDKIWKIATLTFKDSNDRGFEFETSNLTFVLRAKREDYYRLIDTLFSEVLDEFQESDNYNPLIDDFRNFLIAKISGDI